MCLVKADRGFEVFSCTQDARLEVHFFEDEEAAYFYLFGVLAAEAIHSRRLGPIRSNDYVNGSREPGDGTAAATARGNVSKYLRSGNLPKSPSRPASLNKPAGLTVPRSPSSPVGLSNHGLANRIRPVEKESPFALLINRHRFSRPARYFRHVEPGRKYPGVSVPVSGGGGQYCGLRDWST